MHTVHNHFGVLALSDWPRALQAACLALALGSLALVAMDLERTAVAAEQACGDAFDPSASYPVLPQTSGPDVSGEPGIVVHLQDYRGVAEIDGCLYELNRPLEIDFDGLDFVSLLFEIHGDSTAALEVFVTDDSSGYELAAVEGSLLTYTMTTGDGELGFEIAKLAS